MKILTWLRTNGATLIGCLQAIVKALKELLTAVVALISIFMPASKTKIAIDGIRVVLNKVYDVLGKAKAKLLKYIP